MFYQSNGVTALGILSGGAFTYTGLGPNIGTGWKIIVGGR